MSSPFLPLSALSLAAFAVLSLTNSAAAADEPKADTYWVFVGTGGGKAKGIYRFEFDPANGKLTNGELAAEVSNPSFLAIHPNGKWLFTVSERAGGVLAYEIDAKTGKLTKLNSQPVKGNGPCHISVDRSGKFVLVANYGSGSANVFPIADDGKLKEISCFVQDEGKSVHPGNQEGPHAHSANLSKDNRFAIVADLGIDKLLVFKFDADKGTITPNDPAFLATAPGAGPRHFSWHPTAPLGFVINEINSTLSSLSYDAEKGTFKTLKTVSTLPSDYKDAKKNSTAEVVVHPNGKFVYGSNRGHNSIVAFKLDPQTGDLGLIGYATEGIKVPRNFSIDPTGQFMLVGSQAADHISVFKIDPETGVLKATGETVEVGTPICIRYLPVAK
jgi:6-phosphogluconolactonase